MAETDCNIVGVDPHRQTLTAAVVDPRGGLVSTEHFACNGEGFADMLGWARSLGAVGRWGIEGASGLGRPLAEFLIESGCDVREVPPHHAARQRRGRHLGKSDLLDAHRIALEVLASPGLPHAFKRSSIGAPDATRDQLALWHSARRSICKVRVQLLGELDALIADLPEDIRAQLGARATVRARVNAFHKLGELVVTDPVVALRLRLIGERIALLQDCLAKDREATRQIRLLVAHNQALLAVAGIAERAAAELLVEVGDIRRFSPAGFARFNGTAPIPATSGEGSGQPIRHRLSRGGNRRVNAVLHRAAMIQLRCDPRAKALVERARANGHTRREAMRILKRHLSNVIYRAMLADVTAAPALT